MERGTIVKLEEELKGFIPISHYDSSPVEKPEKFFKKDDQIKCIIIDIDERKKTAICSPRAYKKSTEKKEMEQYLKKETTETFKIGDMIQLN